MNVISLYEDMLHSMIYHELSQFVPR